MDEKKENMTTAQPITTETLFEFLKEFKTDVNKRFDDVYERLDYMSGLIKTEKHDRERMNDKLEEIYECRNRIAISFTRSWMMASIFIALLSATVVLAVEKAF